LRNDDWGRFLHTFAPLPSLAHVRDQHNPLKQSGDCAFLRRLAVFIPYPNLKGFDYLSPSWLFQPISYPLKTENLGRERSSLPFKQTVRHPSESLSIDASTVASGTRFLLSPCSVQFEWYCPFLGRGACMNRREFISSLQPRCPLLYTPMLSSPISLSPCSRPHTVLPTARCYFPHCYISRGQYASCLRNQHHINPRSATPHNDIAHPKSSSIFLFESAFHANLIVRPSSCTVHTECQDRQEDHWSMLCCLIASLLFVLGSLDVVVCTYSHQPANDTPPYIDIQKFIFFDETIFHQNIYLWLKSERIGCITGVVHHV